MLNSLERGVAEMHAGDGIHALCAATNSTQHLLQCEPPSERGPSAAGRLSRGKSRLSAAAHHAWTRRSSKGCRAPRVDLALTDVPRLVSAGVPAQGRDWRNVTTVTLPDSPRKTQATQRCSKCCAKSLKSSNRCWSRNEISHARAEVSGAQRLLLRRVMSNASRTLGRAALAAAQG